MSRPALDIFPPGKQFFLTTEDTGSIGDVNNAGYMYVYEPDQAYTTQKTVYKDRAKGTQWTQPITFSSAGLLSSPVKSDGLVDIKIFDSAGNLQESHDNAGDDWSAVGTDLSENLVSNHSFETAGTGGEPFANWTAIDPGSVVSRDTSDSDHGAASLKFTNSTSVNTYWVFSSRFPVTPKRNYRLSFLNKNDNASAKPKVQYIWYDESQSLLSTTTVWNPADGVAPTSWTLIDGLVATPPSTAHYGAIKIIGNETGTQYDSWFDDLRVTPVSPTTFGVVTRIPVGLELSRDSGDTSHDINVTAGAVLDSTYAKEIVLDSEITKKIDAGWAVGDNAGGLPAGSSLSANGYVNVFVGLKSATGLVDVFFDTGSYDSPTPPTGFDYYRYLGMWPLDSSSNLENGTMKGGRFTKLADPTAEVSSTVAYDAATQTAAINAPPLSRIDYAARLEIVSGAATDVVVEVKPADSSWTNTNIGQGMESTTDDLDEFHFRGEVALNSSSQLKWDVTIVGHTGNVTFNCFCLGWFDVLRDNP